MLSLTARGLTTGEVAAHFAEVYGAKVSRDTITRITDTVPEQMAAWHARPGLPGGVRRRDRGQGLGRAGHHRPIYVAIGVTVNGERDILGSGDRRDRAAMSWEYGAGDGHEGAKFWLAVLTEIKNRGARGRVHPGLRRAQGAT